MVLALYAVVTVPLLAVATAAVWVPRTWQVALLLGGPLVTVLAAAGTPGVQDLGWVATLGIPYAYLLVLPLVPWRRPWARTAVPLTVVVLVGLLLGLARFDVSVVVPLALPFTAAVVGLVLAGVARRDRRRDAEALAAGRPLDP